MADKVAGLGRDHHYPMLEAPEEFDAALLDFLRDDPQRIP